MINDLSKYFHININYNQKYFMWFNFTFIIFQLVWIFLIFLILINHTAISFHFKAFNSLILRSLFSSCNDQFVEKLLPLSSVAILFIDIKLI